MIDQIEDKDVKAKYITKVLEQQSTKPKPIIPLANTYRLKYVMQYFKNKEPVTVQDLQIEIKQIKTQIEELKLYTQNIDFRIKNLEDQKDSLTPQTSEELENFVNSMTIVQK